MIHQLKGMYDILPNESGKWLALERTIRNVSKIYNFKEIRTPILEYTELFHRSVGEDTDIVSKETYDFIDRGDRSNTLRPEGTAGVVRSYIENKLYADPIPVQKLYYMGEMFRYERPQKGRYRQFRQFGAEVFGSNSPIVDADVIAYAVSILKSLKINDVTVHINSIGDAKSKEMYKTALLEYLKPNVHELCHDCQVRYNTNPLRILDCKVDQESDIIKQAPKPLDYLTDEAKNHFDSLCNILDSMKIEYKVDHNLVRGLDYYTHTVFEVYAHLETLGSQNAICGGGRYNNLVESLAGPSVPAVGFAFGMERLLFALESINFTGDEDFIHLYIMALGEDQLEDAAKMMQRCRLGGLITEMDYLKKSFKAQFKLASRYNARFVAIYGANEKEDGTINVKDQETGKQVTIPVKNLYNHVVAELMKPADDDSCKHCADNSCEGQE